MLGPHRIMTIPGKELLPQDSKPSIPADIAPDERVRVIPPCPPWRPTAIETMELKRNPRAFPQFDGRYWSVRESHTRHPTDTIGAKDNVPMTGLGLGSGQGFENMPSVIELQFKPRQRKHGLPDFWQRGRFMVMSSRLLDFLLEVDPEAIAHRPIVMRDLDGVTVDEHHHAVDVVRNLPALDFANSIVDYVGARTIGSTTYPPHHRGALSARFCDGLDERHLIFRQRSDYGPGGHGCFVSAALKQRMEKMKPQFSNLAFKALYWGI